MKKPPPLKRPGQQLGRRRIDGALLTDLAGAASLVGLTEKALRARCERGLFPYRRAGGRLVFVKRELEGYVAALAGVSLDEALENLAARARAGAR